MSPRNIIVLDQEDAEASPPNGYQRWTVQVLSDEELLRTYDVFATSIDSAEEIALDRARDLLDVKVIPVGSEEADYTLMDVREWHLNALFAEGYEPPDHWDQAETKKYVTLEASQSDWWMVFVDSVELGLAYFDQSEGDWTPHMIVDLDTGQKYRVGTKSFLLDGGRPAA